MKFFGVLAASIVGLSALTAQAAPVALNLTLAVDQNAKTWQVFGQISGDTARTLGLHGVSFDVVGAGGTVVNSSARDLPTGVYTNPPLFNQFFFTGFVSTTSDGTNGIDIQGAQGNTHVHSTQFNADNIVQGVGLSAGTNNNATFALPALLGHGTYTGAIGTLSVLGLPQDTTFLPATLPASTPSGAGFATFSPDTVTGQTVIIGAGVPEPASLSILALGGVALLTRRRKA